MSARVVGAFAVPPRPDGNAFVKFTLPAFELRRLLLEARTRNESFSIEYSHLNGAEGDERWRIGSTERRVTVVERFGEETTCIVTIAGGGLLPDPKPCDDGDLAIAPFPTPNFVERPLLSMLGFM